jgi:hypothetical protein
MPKLEIRNSKFAAHDFNSAVARVHEVLDSRLRGNDPRTGSRVSNFDFRVSVLITDN